jgi:hypothetical protein
MSHLYWNFFFLRDAGADECSGCDSCRHLSFFPAPPFFLSIDFCKDMFVRLCFLIVFLSVAAASDGSCGSLPRGVAGVLGGSVKAVSSQAECCDYCSSLSTCVAATYKSQQCLPYASVSMYVHEPDTVVLIRSSGPFTPSIASMGPLAVLGSFNSSTLYAANVSGYDSPYLIANISGASRFELGYSAGTLLRRHAIENFNFLFQALFHGDELLEDILKLFMDVQYDLFATKQLPDEYKEELHGLQQAMIDAGEYEMRNLYQRGLILSSFPGSVQSNIEWLIIDELGLNAEHEQRRAALKARAAVLSRDFTSAVAEAMTAATRALHRSCSHFGVWGSRTQGGDLFSGRNLDWLANTGIAKNKLLTVIHPPEAGRHAHVAIAFAGLWGALTGLSSEGISVHESGDDNKMETMEGFHWTLRLRYIMERSVTIEDAVALWRATNNTFGINHGIGSASSSKYVALETKATYTAYFYDNDPREAARNVNGTQYGFPLPEAVWRTNHGYDPTFLATAIEPIPGPDTFARYMLLHDTFVYYASLGNMTIGALQAVNLTAIVGDKGDPPTYQRFLTCPAGTGGSNVISATFHPAQRVAFVAFEDGLDAKHKVAGCNAYATFDLKAFL